MRYALVLAVTLALAAAACGGGDSQPTPEPSLTASATATPTPALTPEVSAEEACPSAIGKGTGNPPFLYSGWEPGEIVCWIDAPGEASYRIEGSVQYWIPPPTWRCDETPPAITPLPDPVTSPAPEPSFSKVLPANTTRFRLPVHPDPRLHIKDFDFRVAALDSDGEVIARGGTSLTKDAFCE